MKVHFIGAGPGAADLITVRGRSLVERCPVPPLGLYTLLRFEKKRD